jgi:hypothetical protein
VFIAEICLRQAPDIKTRSPVKSQRARGPGRLVGLNWEAIKLFHGTLRKQLSLNFNRVDYDACLGGLYTRTTRELYDMGRKFRYGR